MKRDMDLCRKVLLEVEANPRATGPAWVDLDIKGWVPAELAYHVQLLHEAGFLEASDLTTTAGLDWRPIRLTYEGHEFVEAARKETRWRKAKSLVLEKTGGLSLDVLKAVLVKLATEAVVGG